MTRTRPSASRTKNPTTGVCLAILLAACAAPGDETERELLLNYARHAPGAIDEAMRGLARVMTGDARCDKRHRHGRRTAA